jgi:hypothetical protein
VVYISLFYPHYLVGGLEHFFIFPYSIYYIGNVIIPTHYIIFFRGVAQPPTSGGWRNGDWLQPVEAIFPTIPSCPEFCKSRSAERGKR